MKNDFWCWIGSVMGTIMTATQTDEVLRYVQLGLTILSTLFALAYTIWKWWRKAKQDGKITEEEVDELLDDVNGVVNKKDEEKEKKDD